MNKKIGNIIDAEFQRQNETLGLIASENYSSKAVREAVGSVLMHKYSEGYPGKRYYEGNDEIDKLEDLCRNLAIEAMLSNDEAETRADWHANVQVLSGSIANLAVYNSVLKPGDKVLSMYLPDGGHLSHGWSYGSKSSIVSESQGANEEERNVTLSLSKGRHDHNNDLHDNPLAYLGGSKNVNFTSKLFNVVQYKTDPKTHLFDYDAIEEIALEFKPKYIITGGTAYPREIDYARMREIADKVSAYYHADVAHEAGLIAAGVMNSPFIYADFVTFTTHKTLRGPKGAVAMCRKKYAKKLDRSVFPGLQGGPFNHNIAGIAQAFSEILEPEFKDYASQVIKNAKVFADELGKNGFRVITGGTDKHLIVAEVLESKGVSGKYLARALAMANIVSNMNTVPYEKGSPSNPSGMRFGTPLITTRGMKEPEVKNIVEFISRIADVAKTYADLDFDEFQEKMSDSKVVKEVKAGVIELCRQFPLD